MNSHVLHRYNKEVQEISDLMRKYEQEKYPVTHYAYAKDNVESNNLPIVTKDIIKAIKDIKGPMDIIYVNYDGEKLDDDEYSSIKEAAIKIRKLSLIAGVINAMGFSPHYLGRSELQQSKIIEKLIELKEEVKNDKIIHENKSIDEMDEFVEEMVLRIGAITKKEKDKEKDFLIRRIRNAERYFVAEYNRNRMLVFETRFDDKKNRLFQVDVPYNKLTKNQKEELQNIHNMDPNKRPDWFNSLSDYEQDWLRQVIPSLDNKEKWEYFESLSQSSAMQHIPGVSNARKHYLLKQSITNGEVEVLSKNLKLGTIVPYEMPNQKIAKASAKQNVEQALELLYADSESNYAELKNLFGELPKDFKPTILFQSLLSDTFAENIYQFALGDPSKSDNVLTKTQLDTVNENKHNDKFQVLASNDVVNKFRKVYLPMGDRWDNVELIKDQAKKLLFKRELNAEQRKRINLISDASDELEELYKKGSTKDDVNFEAYKTAYLAILVEKTGGAVSTNCKSGKDRTGYEEIYRNAMLEYFEAYNILPSYYDNAPSSTNFINIFVKLFNSRKAQEAAAGNTPGSFGLKDEAGMLCPRIAKALGTSYAQSNDLSAMNKPNRFQDDEKAQAKEEAKPAITTQYEDKKDQLYVYAWECYRNVDEIIKNPVDADFIKNKIEAIVEQGLKRNHKIENDEVRILAANNILSQISQCKSIESLITLTAQKKEPFTLFSSKKTHKDASHIRSNSEFDAVLNELHKSLEFIKINPSVNIDESKLIPEQANMPKSDNQPKPEVKAPGPAADEILTNLIVTTSALIQTLDKLEKQIDTMSKLLDRIAELRPKNQNASNKGLRV